VFSKISHCKMLARRWRRGSQSGAAMMTALSGMLILALIAAALNVQARTAVVTARSAETAARHKYAAEAGAYLALSRLLNPAGYSYVPQNGGAMRGTLEGVEMTTRIQHERGKINLNVKNNPLLRRLLLASCLSAPGAAEIMRQLTDFMNAGGSAPQGESGYLAQNALNAAPVRPLSSIHDLQRLPAMTQGLFDRLQPHISVHAFNLAPDPLYETETIRSLRNETAIGPRSSPPVEIAANRPSGVYTMTVTTHDGGQDVYSLSLMAYITGDRQNPYIVIGWRREFARESGQICTGSR